jgi:hypothetical protein
MGTPRGHPKGLTQSLHRVSSHRALPVHLAIRTSDAPR